ncbi:phosphate ABC transporter permease subunit PstC [Schumannella soli]|uniref:Phosphate transport system permease protein n=1 Tax=Schumannella soli TaxID=2590779 RepID=A0A506Y0M6_9MICO|nr:phosphate ABC transporter permease subunit PstC [Schumannella soli]TPW75522.1 phosphate ABC transporter permease subunit PstC [Schumannella soli]
MTDSTTVATSSASEGAPGPAPRQGGRALTGKGSGRAGDKVFLGLSSGSAWLIMVILAGVAIFLIIRSLPGIAANWETSSELNSGPTAGFANFWAYAGPLLWGTIWAAFIALILGTPVAIGIALFISHYAPRRLAGALGYLVDLLAAVPSVVFGLWGIIVIRPFLLPLEEFLNTYLGWLPFFSGTVSRSGSTILAGGVVLAVMILPIITSITREIFLQTPRLHEEAALALGATRWEMIKLSVFPYARSGMVSATLLGLGRALGETMAIALIISPSILFSLTLVTEGENSQTIAANIATNFPIATDLQRSALTGTGLMLFVVSFAVNFIARWIVARTGPGATRKTRTRTPKAKTA